MHHVIAEFMNPLAKKAVYGINFHTKGINLLDCTSYLGCTTQNSRNKRHGMCKVFESNEATLFTFSCARAGAETQLKPVTGRDTQGEGRIMAEQKGKGKAQI